MRRARYLRLVPALVALALLVAACGSGSEADRAVAKADAAARQASVGSPCGTRRRPPRRWRHVVWIVMENKAVDQIIGARAAPYLTRLAARCGTATRFYAESHPSLPNYIAMTSGSTQGIGDDRDPDSHRLSAPSIFSQLGSGWRALQESMPSRCAQHNSGLYAVRHNPAAYYTGLRAACNRQDVPLGSRPDLSARFTFITPNICSDMHSCPRSQDLRTQVAIGDAWLARRLPRILGSRQYRAGSTVVFVTWDEDDGSASNRIATLVISPSTRRGTRSSTRFDHYSLLRTTEDLLRLRGHLGRAAGAPSMRRAFNL
jgi:phosphatidylinositol-3-phosphatase